MAKGDFDEIREDLASMAFVLYRMSIEPAGFQKIWSIFCVLVDHNLPYLSSKQLQSISECLNYFSTKDCPESLKTYIEAQQ